MIRSTMHMLRNSSTFLTAMVLILLSSFSSAQSENTNPKENNQLNIPFSQKIAIIDGEINDEIWKEALNVPLTIVNNPWDNKKSPVDTLVKIVENGEYIYIAFLAQDPEPEKINGFLADRDSTLEGDIVGIKLDTFNSRRLNYNFLVNPFGVQNDSIANEVTGEVNNLWDGIWQSYGKLTPAGYQVEIAIPYHILNFEENNDIKTWAIELIRLYPRDERLRISHISLDRDNNCWVCQMPEIKGFKNAEVGKNLVLTPAIVANNNQNRDIFDPNDTWHDDNDIDAGLDLRWGPNANTLLNVTLNPDFSTVESDAGQLNINKTFSLFYDEKRTFFLENSDYFSSNYNLVYTRNIADPDYGVKFTGRDSKHSYGVFVTNDTETNFIVPGNLSDDLAVLNIQSHSAAFNYRYNVNDNLSIGTISTMRTADNYHNIVAGIDTKYRLDDSNSISAQLLHSTTEYPEDLFIDFCLPNPNAPEDKCGTAKNTDCHFGNCAISEQVHRTNIVGEFKDQAYKIDFKHDSEYWQINAGHQQINDKFRADLGFITQTDFKESAIDFNRLFYGDDNSLWEEAKLKAEWSIQHNENGELLARSISTGFEITGPMLSFFSIDLAQETKVGLRDNDSILNIDGNTDRFEEISAELYAEFHPTSYMFLGVGTGFGDKIDYTNNRLASFNEISTYLQVHVTNHLFVDIFHTYSKLQAPNKIFVKEKVYSANLIDLRISYQFDVQSSLKLSIVYSDVDRNPDNNPFDDVSRKNRNLSTQLIYSYKLNPRTVFFLGYSDNSYQDDNLRNLEREQKTFFTKISYAWRP